MIKGRKIVLREKRLEDAEDDYAWRCDAELARLDAAPPLCISFSHFMATYAWEIRSSNREQHRFAIETLDGKHIGNCMYYGVDKRRKEAEIGIMLGDRSYWDQGYGTDAVKTLTHHIFKEAKLQRLCLHTLTWNLRAQRCFEKCGFVPCGHLTRQGNDFIVMELWRSWLDENRELEAEPAQNSGDVRD
jgi:RimJ/RimL family protein N-acetyltransferase